MLGIWIKEREEDMKTGKQIPKHKNYEEMAEFWDSHSLADYWDQTKPADFEVSKPLRHSYLISVDRELLIRISRLARHRGVSIETLANVLLEQRVENIELQR